MLNFLSEIWYCDNVVEYIRQYLCEMCDIGNLLSNVLKISSWAPSYVYSSKSFVSEATLTCDLYPQTFNLKQCQIRGLDNIVSTVKSAQCKGEKNISLLAHEILKRRAMPYSICLGVVFEWTFSQWNLEFAPWPFRYSMKAFTLLSNVAVLSYDIKGLADHVQKQHHTE